MNNIPQKNIIFENSRNNGLPYYNAGNIQYVGGQNINFATLNNTFQQLIDNDLYVENYVRNYAERVVGPKSSAPSAVYAGVEGYKAFSDDGVQMHIYRKHENPLSSSVSCVLPDVNVNFVSQTGQYVIAGCDEGIYFEQNGFHRLANDIPAYGQYFSDQVNLIASEDGVYSLVMKSGYDISQYHLFIKLNSNDIGVCRSVHYIEETHTIVVGTDSGIYEGDCYSYMLGREDISCKVNFAKMKMLDGTTEVSPEVNALTASGATPIAATSGGIFKPDKIYDFSGYGRILSGHDIRYRLDDGEKWLVGTDDGVYSVAYNYGGNGNKVIDIMNSVAAVSAETGLYLATPDSIFRYANDQLDTLVSGINRINQLQVYSSIAGDFPIFASDSVVYYMGDDNDYAELVTIDGASINDILVNGHELFVATTSGIYKYKLYVGSALYDSEKIISSVNAYESIIDDDFGPSGLIDINGSLYTYSGQGLKGLSNPTDFIDISVSNCCTVKLDDGTSIIVTAADQVIRIFDDKLFKQADIHVGSAVQDIKTTDNMVLFRLADKTLWQIHKNKLLDINPGGYLTRVTAYSGVDDFTTYGEYAAIRQGTELKFLQEYSKPSLINKLSGYIVNSLQYNEKYDVIFVSTNKGLSAIDMSIIDPITSSWTECRIYSGNTYGCWSSEDKLYSFVDNGVDVYDIMRMSQDGENRISCRYRHTVMKKQKLTVNAMCEMDGRQLYATRNGLYASVSAEVYTSRLAWPDNISFCYKTTLSDQDDVKDLFICQDSSGLFRYFDGCTPDQRVINGGGGLIVTGCAMSNYADGCLYIATSSSGLYLYNIQANTLTKCDNIPAGASIVGISSVKYKADSSKIFVACVENLGTQAIFNKVFIEVGSGVFEQVMLSPNIVDNNQNDQIIRAEFIPTDGINDAQLFIYMKTVRNDGQEYKVKVVSISDNGQIMTDYNVSATLDHEYDKVYASRDRFVYIMRSDDTSAYVYAADTAGEYEAHISEIQGVSQIFKDSRGGVYIRKTDGYYQAEAGLLRRLLVSDSEFQDRVIGLDYYDSRSGYIIVKTDADGTGGIYQVEPDDTQVVPIRTNFENKQLYSIQNVFGLIITSYNNKIYWSDVEKVEDLSVAANYNVILNQAAGAVFTGCCVSEETGMAYAYGVKFVLSWQAANRNQFIQNADNYTRETYNNIFNFNIRKIIPHESKVIDAYLNSGINYNKPYVLLDSGISIYDKNNISMLAKPSTISETVKLFQIPDGIAYLAKSGVMYTTNCESAEKFIIRGVALTEKTQGIKYDGKDYYIQSDGHWYYIYHGNMVPIPDGGQITDILRLGGFTTYIRDGKIFRFEYAKTRRMTAREYDIALDKYDIYRIFAYGNVPYYVSRSTRGVQLFDERYSPIRIYFEDRPGSQFFDNICLAGTGNLIVVRIDGDTYFCKSFSEVAQKYDVEGLVFPVNVYVKNEYTGLDSDSGIVKFNKYGVVNVYRRIDDAPAKFTKILKVGDEDYIVCSNEGLYRYIQDFVYKMSGENTTVGCVYMDMFDGVPGYVIANNSDICRSSDLIDWRIIFSSGIAGDIHDIYVKSLNDYYVATSAGVVKTIYSYQLINDIEQRNEYELQAVVDSLTDNLSQTFENQLGEHLINWHSSSSQMYFINNKMLSVDMSGIAKEWQNIQTGPEFVVENDLIDTMDFGDLSALGCDISTYNSIFSQEYAPAEYILKRYMSGVTEMLIHVQTTQTYYLNGVPGSPVPRDESEVVLRKNLESITELEPDKKKQNSSVSEHATKITLRIPKQVADISDIHDVQICPCSLPLKVYSDNVDINDMEKNGIYNSKVIPSIVLSYGEDSDCTVFNFMCFGTDEQSIRLQFAEMKSQIAKDFVTVEFYPNGGEGGMPVQRIQVGVQTNLSMTRFVNSGKFFLGWSFQPLADGQRPTYTNGQQVVLSPDEYADGDVIKLYAVWTEQNIEGDANIFGIESDGSTLYIKSAVEVVPGQTIIDYGDGSDMYIPSDDMPVGPQPDPDPEPEIVEDGDYLTDDDIL